MRLLLVFLLLASAAVRAADLGGFVSKHCMECHDDATRKADSPSNR